jgi:hypothetical protein
MGFGEFGELTEGDVPAPGAVVAEPGEVGVPMPDAPPVGLAGAPPAAAAPPAPPDAPPPAAWAIAKPEVEIIMANTKAGIFFISQRRLKLD